MSWIRHLHQTCRCIIYLIFALCWDDSDLPSVQCSVQTIQLPQPFDQWTRQEICQSSRACGHKMGYWLFVGCEVTLCLVCDCFSWRSWHILHTWQPQRFMSIKINHLLAENNRKVETMLKSIFHWHEVSTTVPGASTQTISHRWEKKVIPWGSGGFCKTPFTPFPFLLVLLVAKFSAALVNGKD